MTGRSPDGSGQSGLHPEPVSRLGHSETVPNAGFTPGPWKAEWYESEVEIFAERTSAGGQPFPSLSDFYIYVSPDDMARHPVTEANARLIAAAPELYRELTRLQMLAERFIESCPARTHKATQARNILYTAIDDASVVIAKARGETL